MLFAHGNTFRIVEPIVRWFAPNVSAHDLATAHNVTRKMGHFLIPAVAFWVLVLGPLRDRPILALVACIAFACLDEAFQTFSPGRTGSVMDVMLDTFGALFGFFRPWRDSKLAGKATRARAVWVVLLVNVGRRRSIAGCG